jgi:hypothetical protein
VNNFLSKILQSISEMKKIVLDQPHKFVCWNKKMYTFTFMRMIQRKLKKNSSKMKFDIPRTTRDQCYDFVIFSLYKFDKQMEFLTKNAASLCKKIVS